MKPTAKQSPLILIIFLICAAAAIGLVLVLVLFQFSPEIVEDPLIIPPPANEVREPATIEAENPPPPPLPPPPQVRFDVPFTAQAPFGDWDDVKQDYGCEEACLIMAMAWVENQDSIDPNEARDDIVAMSEFQLKNYNHHHDTSVSDTLKVLKDYFGYTRAFSEYDIGLSDIKSELAAGNLVIIPIDGMSVNNPYYTPPGPFQHQVLVIGYDDDKQILITHDPGTRQGAAFPYPYEEIEGAIMDYETGLDEPIPEPRTAMLVIQPREE